MPAQETRPRSRRPERTYRYRTGRRCRAHRMRWLSPRTSCGTAKCRSFGMPRELDLRRMADQSLGRVGGLDEDLGATRLSAEFSVGRMQLELSGETIDLENYDVGRHANMQRC